MDPFLLVDALEGGERSVDQGRADGQSRLVLLPTPARAQRPRSATEGAERREGRIISSGPYMLEEDCL
jgi:hypothetical protein